MASSLKFAVLLTLAVVVVSVSGQKGGKGGVAPFGNTIEVGEREKGDSQLYRQRVDKKNEAQKPVSLDIVAARNNCKINYYKVTDNTSKGFGAMPEEIEGGLGNTRIVLRLTSTEYNGIDADVEIRCVKES